ncbi:MAG: M56 family metallopeptidase [Gemmatimonadaceae bacterium]|nr:M56 family metallopeptidase [Gemmatimonadaceae bacterium]
MKPPEQRTYLASPVRKNEQLHRRVLLLGISTLLIFGTSPVFGHHVAGRADALLAGKDHLWVLCLVAAHQILAPVHLIFHVLFLSGVVYAAWDRGRAWRSARRWLALVDGATPKEGDAYWTGALGAGLLPTDVVVVEGLPVPAFTAGWIRPRVYVARILDQLLAPDELVAVLAHEAAHVRHRDPLIHSLLRGVALVLWWIPALRRLADDVADEAEVRADDAAARQRPLVLASAILSLANWRAASNRMGMPATVMAFQHLGLLDRRIRRLAGEEAPIGTHLTRRSLAYAGTALVLVWISGIMMLHPLPTAANLAQGEDNCERHCAPVVMHLLCPISPEHGHNG